MIYILLIYLNGILNGISIVAWFTFFTAAVFLVLILILVWADVEFDIETATSRGKVAIKALVISTSLLVFIPSEDSRRLMVAVYIGNEIVNTEEFQETSGKAYQLLQDWLDQSLEAQEEKN